MLKIYQSPDLSRRRSRKNTKNAENIPNFPKLGLLWTSPCRGYLQPNLLSIPPIQSINLIIIINNPPNYQFTQFNIICNFFFCSAPLCCGQHDELDEHSRLPHQSSWFASYSRLDYCIIRCLIYCPLPTWENLYLSLYILDPAPSNVRRHMLMRHVSFLQQLAER